MKLPELLRNRLGSLLQLAVQTVILRRNDTSKTEVDREETIATKSTTTSPQTSKLGTVKKILLKSRQLKSPTKPFKKASLFPDGKTNLAALSLLLHGVAEVLSQKRDLPWKTETQNNLSYEKATDAKKGTISYYVTDNLENLSPDTISESAALAVIDRFDPRAGAIHLIYCAAAANLHNPWQSEFLLDDKQLLEYSGLIKRRDLCRHEQLTILYDLVRQPAQILAHVVWEKQGKVGAFTVADLKIWNVNVARDFETDKAGNPKLTGLKVIVQPGLWAKYFLNKSEYYYHTGVITKKTVQTLFSIGKQNAGAARMLIWLIFQVKPGCRKVFSGKSLMQIAYGMAKIALAEQDRQLRRQLADDLATDLKVIEAAGWRVEVETGPAWLLNNDGAKRPIGFWSQLLDTTWRFDLPEAALTEIAKSPNQLRGVERPKQQPPSGAAIREARKAKGWSRAFFAATMGKSISWVDAIETEHRQVSQKDLPKLLEKLEMKS
ncbi:XRE family transcriptional regulator [Chroococcidiopsis sp. CCALA 051]|uniref:helix-turn-helix domain-containing protein n=1 Tax=Chroococcidiopsis sp. CCALA 051 TaxID=869949 RepID=UPI000D0DBAFC|nr:helix-turn-helix transcriptional regulator [Chroococcidiopsis sp. CCALA 051]MBE9015291.1 helix-turn-helix transcriptional regulator [Chroococcidiopsidales cyanobacterium LEGE 13417]PSM48080.1 XRE family transcriptional regulator [Chroococcidiopsis sp. CCALA 051]